MTTTTRNAKIEELQGLIENLHAELDACPNSRWNTAYAQDRHTLLIAYAAKLRAIESSPAIDDVAVESDWTEEDAYGKPYPPEDFSTEDTDTDRRSKPLTFLVTRHYEIVTELSAEKGEPEETGTEFSDDEMSLRDTVEQLREMHCTSRYPIQSAEDCDHTWAYTHEEIDYSTGESRTESVHVKRADGSALAGRDLFRLYRLAGLVSVA